MRKWILLVPFLFLSHVFAQVLSPVAQALYMETFNADTSRGNYALNNGASFFSSPDSSIFYLQWFPNTSQPDTLPLIVTLHGSNGNVFNEFFLWHPYAVANNCGIVAIQWYRGGAALPPNDYSLDTIIYNTIESALASFNYPSGKALLHGFSRGSARSYAINLYDALSGNNYFCTTISNAGAYQPGYPLYTDIDNNVYGSTPFAGKRWALYCGNLDTNYTQSGCPGMMTTSNWLSSKGATVDVFIQDPIGTHGGFHLNSANVDSILDYYLPCFYGSVSIEENLADQISVYPNPNHGDCYIQIPSAMMSENYHIELYDQIGKLVYRRPLKISMVYLDAIHPGYYSFLIFDGGRMVKKGKLVVQ